MPIVLGALMVAASTATALSDPASSRFDAPSLNYSIVISDGPDKSAINPNRLSIFHGKTELAHYSFDGNYESVRGIYWSPKERFVAFDDHYGHRCWAVWVISLKDGAVIQPGRSEHSPYFDIYIDGSLPDVLGLARAQIAAVYPGYKKDEDRRGGGHIAVVYGWKNDSTLSMFDEMIYDDLAGKENACLSIYSLLKVEKSGLSASHFTVAKTDLTTSAGRPPEVLKILGY